MKGKGLNLSVSLFLLAALSVLIVSCKGPAGDKGPDGPQGPQGVQGQPATQWIFVDKDTTWSPGNGPIVIDRNVLVKSGVTLTIMPGATVVFYPDMAIFVDGALKAEGTTGNKITFKLKDEFVDLINDINDEGVVVTEKRLPSSEKRAIVGGPGTINGFAVGKDGQVSIKNAVIDNYLDLMSSSEKPLVVDNVRFNGGSFFCISGKPTITNSIFTKGDIAAEYECCPSLISGDSVHEVFIDVYLYPGSSVCNTAIRQNRLSGYIEIDAYGDTGEDEELLEIARQPSAVLIPSYAYGKLTADVSDNTINNDYDHGVDIYGEDTSMAININRNSIISPSAGIYFYCYWCDIPGNELVVTDNTVVSTKGHGFDFNNYYSYVNATIEHNDFTGGPDNYDWSGIFIDTYWMMGDENLFKVNYNNVSQFFGEEGIELIDPNYHMWATVENNNITGNDYGIWGAGVLRGNYIAGNNGTAPWQVDSSTGGVANHVYDAYSKSKPDQWGEVDACLSTRSNPNPDAGPR